MTEKVRRYSLWLRPNQAQTSELEQVISRLARDYGTTPFPPHVTLLPNITARLDKVRQVCTKLVRTTREINLPLQEIGYSETYHRNFFILVEPVQVLSELYRCAKTALGYITKEHFIPHLSLLYGSLDLKTKRKLKQEIEGTYPTILHCQRLDLYDIAGDVAGWSCIDSYELAKVRR